MGKRDKRRKRQRQQAKHVVNSNPAHRIPELADIHERQPCIGVDPACGSDNGAMNSFDE
jgi:hypothetical protein